MFTMKNRQQECRVPSEPLTTGTFPVAARQALAVVEPVLGEAPLSTSSALVAFLASLGVRQVFGVIGGGIAPFCEATSRSPLRFIHCRHEAGAAFAAIEASLAGDALTVVAVTTGPGMTNLLTGMVAARAEGAKVLFVTGMTNAAQRGRGAFQESSAYGGPYSLLFNAGELFHHAQMLEDPAELESFCSRLANGVQARQGFVAHLGLPLNVQNAPAKAPRVKLHSMPAQVPVDAAFETCVELLSAEPFVIWAGFGARHASAEVRCLAEATGARVMCSPRAKGVFPEEHPLYLGVTGLGGHAATEAYVSGSGVARALVLGSRLGEMTSFWSSGLVPEDGFIHVDLDPSAFGAAFPGVPTLGITAEVRAFLQALLKRWPEQPELCSVVHSRRTRTPASLAREFGRVRPSYLMGLIQRRIVRETNAIVLTEAGNSFVLGSHHLRFMDPLRYRVSTRFGAMGQAVAGVIGAALSADKAVAIVGDGAMLMLNEISTAAQYRIPAVWIVLNDARYGMIANGMASLGWKPFATDFPETDFVAIARAMGADGVRVEREEEVDPALQAAMSATGPFVVDVLIDRSEAPPANRRNQSLVRQGAAGTGGRS